MASIFADSAMAVRPGLLDRASRSRAAMREASTPSGAISRARVADWLPLRAVAVMPPMVMCTANCSMPRSVASKPIASRTRKAVSPDRSIEAPKRSRTSRDSATAGFCSFMERAGGPRSGSACSDRVQPQHCRRVLAYALDERGVRLQVMAVGGDHLLELGHPVADQLLMEAVLQHMDHDPDGRGGARRRAEQGHDRRIGRRHDLGAEFQCADMRFVLQI